MLRRIVDITGDGKRLSLERGFLAVSGPEGPLGSVPLDDIEAVISETPAVQYSGMVLDALAARGAPVVICGTRYTPSMWMLPVDGHHAQGMRMDAQAQASLPLRKRLWSEVVRAKITAQAEALAQCQLPHANLVRLRDRIKSGDPGNIEALAAQSYFPTMFGKDFRRNRDAEGANALLNYGYTVLRAATARAIVAAGLHPSLSIFHQSRGTALRLGDDLMEPFRPVVDLVVRNLLLEGQHDLDKHVKKTLVEVLHLDLGTDEGRTPLTGCLARLASSLAQVYLAERRKLIWPNSFIPLPDDASETPL